MNTVTLITGGCRSGKSRYALDLARLCERRVFIATAEGFDDEMRDRISKHQAERGPGFETIEAPCDLAGALRGLSPAVDVAVVDCLTVWLGNLTHRHGETPGIYPEVTDFLKAIEEPVCNLLLVTNEVGLGVVPENAMARCYRDLAGRLNQEVACRAERVIMMVCGLALFVKGDPENGR